MVWLVDSRRELNGEDLILLNWLVSEQIETQILLCKIDKLSRNQGQQALHKLNKQLKELNVPRDLVSTQVYSSTSKEGLVKLTNRLAEWFARVEELDLPVTPQDEEPDEHI
ncbi:MAG TPA: hypothetical protein DHW71_07900 [Gammaproteobacteria bacterium]|nr:hypothetical protein [Gammaproteobacteria bacterium]